MYKLHDCSSELRWVLGKTRASVLYYFPPLLLYKAFERLLENIQELLTFN